MQLNLKIGDILENEKGSATVAEITENNVILEYEDGSREEVSIEDISIEEETSAAETIKAKSTTVSNSDPKSKVEALNAIMHHLAARSTTEVINHYNEMMAQIGKETEKLPSGANSGSNAATIKAKPSDAVKEDMDVIFNGAEFSEEFKDKAFTLFNAAVGLKITEEVVRLEEEYESNLNDSLDGIHENIMEQINDYFEYAANKWLEENKVAIESTLKNEIVSDFIEDLKNVFETHYIDVPEEKVNVFENIVQEKEQLVEKYNELVAENIELMKVLEEAAKNEIFDEVKEGLTLIQVEKFKTLAEGVEFSDLENYKAKLEVVKENYFSKTVNTDSSNVEGQVEESFTPNNNTIKSYDPSIDALAKAIKRTSK